MLRSLWICLLLSLSALAASELAPKQGATFNNTWQWDGRELRPKSGATFATTFVWDGRILQPKTGATFANSWTFDGKEWRKKSGATFANTWVVSGDIPIPVAAVIVLHQIPAPRENL